ncbi:MAG: hypothetical protein AAGA85_21570 [Bacteroidota bacterium]
MRPSDRRRFEQLKLEVVRRMRSEHPDLSADISTWRKRELELLQEALSRETKSQVSEKWFYTHMKSNHGSLPRIDMLDMLSQFVGYKNWDDFRPSRSTAFPLPWMGSLLAILSVVGLGWWILIPSCSTFCFVNLFGRQPINSASIDVFVHPTDESPLMLSIDEQGCVCVQEVDNEVKMTVRSAYFVNDTILRRPSNRAIEFVALRPDDNAQMIRMFANGKVEDWQRYRAHLLGMFMPNARIYEFAQRATAPVGLFNREEFVDLLTLPYMERADLKIIEIAYERDKIITLRFERK